MLYVLGFDGGGTKTECVLMDSTRQIRATTRSGPSNPLRVGFDAASSAIAQAAQFATREANVEPSQINAVCAGLAGVGSHNSHEEMERLITGMFPKAAVRLITDLELSLEATGQRPAIVLVAGTGSAAIGRDAAGHTARAGGHGPLLSDQGSAYDGRPPGRRRRRPRTRSHRLRLRHRHKNPPPPKIFQLDRTPRPRPHRRRRSFPPRFPSRSRCRRCRRPIRPIPPPLRRARNRHPRRRSHRTPQPPRRNILPRKNRRPDRRLKILRHRTRRPTQANRAKLQRRPPARRPSRSRRLCRARTHRSALRVLIVSE